jgi:hypothetical protein
MSLNTALKIIIEEYPKAMGMPFKNNEVASFERAESFPLFPTIFKI